MLRFIAGLGFLAGVKTLDSWAAAGDALVRFWHLVPLPCETATVVENRVTLLEEWGVPLAVSGMLLATLFMAWVLRRHQAYRARMRSAVGRLEGNLLRITHGLAALGAVPLSRELRVTLRGDVLARYRAIARQYRGYPAIRQKIAAAEAAAGSEGAPVNTGVGAIDDEQTFRRTSRAIDDLVDIVGHGATLQPIPRDVRVIFLRELGERRAEVLSRYHLVEARRCEDRHELARGRAHLTTLMHHLRQRGPRTPFVQQLQHEAEQALATIGHRNDSAAASTGTANAPGQGLVSAGARGLV